VENGIRLAASLCVYALRAGLSAGFASNMPLGESKDCTLLLPAPGSAREEELLTAFARQTIRCVRRFPTLLEDLTAHSGLDVLVLSSYDSESIREGIGNLRRAGNQVTFHLLEGGEV